MNGTTYSNFDNQEHVLKLGETFEKHPKSGYHTVRCKWDLESCLFTVANSSMLVSFVAIQYIANSGMLASFVSRYIANSSMLVSFVALKYEGSCLTFRQILIALCLC